ncbi:hypothetical protein, partial [Pseudomonas sp. L13]|uniref:hypothetical protein n=1 Tax=Pseudomonas sp. L13 TaxID=343985 RepID=UPI001C49860C
GIPAGLPPQIPVEFRPAWFNGAPKIKSGSLRIVVTVGSYRCDGGRVSKCILTGPQSSGASPLPHFEAFCALRLKIIFMNNYFYK